MQSRNFKPPEERTSPVPIFVLGLALVAATFWTVWDETFTRRPWKNFQKQFNAYERQIVEKELAKVRSTSSEKLKQLDEKIQKLQAELAADGKLAALREQLKALELDAFEKVQEFGFAKALHDEAYFELQEAIRQGHDIAQVQAHADETRAEMDRLKPLADEAEARRDAVKANIEARRKDLEDMLRQRRQATQKVSGLERRLQAINSRTYAINQVVLREFSRNNFGESVMEVDRCQTCHLAINRAGFEKSPQPFRTHPDRKFYLKGGHDTKKIGCVSCHGGQGPAVTSVDTAHGNVEFWEDPLLVGAETQTKCRSCHSEVFNIPRAPQISKGISLVRELGCFGCHILPGTEGLRRVGPDLSRVQEKVRPEWLVAWIKRPRDYNPRTKMPFFSLSERESRDIATYVWTVGKRRAEKKTLAGLDEPALIEEGKALFESVGCLGCHVRGEADRDPGPALEGVNGRPLVYRNRDFAPALGKIGQKVQPDWLFRWLKNPKAYWHGTKMPRLRLSDPEAKAITAYLVSLSPPAKAAEGGKLGDAAAFERGKKLVALRGCFACHIIPGTENLSKIGPDLSTFATKKPTFLSFGNVVDTPYTWEAWTFAKLKNPKIYQTERENLRMPNFDLTDEEATAIRTLLRTMAPQRTPNSVRQNLAGRTRKVELGRRMIEKYNCTGCHVVENWGGNILRRYKDKNNGPPFLTGEGEKIQPGWFFGFLKNVAVLRPWLKIRMPSFDMPEKDAAALVDYFAALDNKLEPYVHFDPTTVSEETRQAAKTLIAKADCFSCHGVWPPPPGKEPPSAPNFNYAKSRLRPDWILRWIRNPSKIRPGTKMPTFFEGAGTKAEILRGIRGEKEDGQWTYELATTEEADLPEEQFATLRTGGQAFRVKVMEVDEKKIRILSPVDLGKAFARAELESHGEPIDPELLEGDAYKQIQALRDYLMVEKNITPPSSAAPKPEAKAPRARGEG